MSRVMIIIVFLVIQSLGITADDPCRFETSKGVIDLTSVGRDDGKAVYADQMPQTSTGYKYSYNPCRPFSEGTACQNVAACQVSADGHFTFSLGGQDTATWNDGSSFGIDPSVSYTINQKVARVSLECISTDNPSFEVLGETAVNIFGFRLRHKCACWNGCKNPPDTTTAATNTTHQSTNTTKITKPTSTSTHTTETKSTRPPTATTPEISTTEVPLSTAGDGNVIGRRPILMTIILGFVLLVYSMTFATC